MSGCKLASIANAVEALTISGIRVKDIDNIPVSSTVRDVFLFPKPDGWVGGFSVTPQSQGTTATGRRVDLRYSLTYNLCVGNIGAGRADVIDFYDTMVADVVRVINAVTDIATLVDGVEISVSDLVSFGAVATPDGVLHPGASIVFDVLEFYEV